jgi:hypothetical protein
VFFLSPSRSDHEGIVSTFLRNLSKDGVTSQKIISRGNGHADTGLLRKNDRVVNGEV